jgi:peptidyl-dipeptidase A
VKLDDVTARKLYLLKQSLVLPAPSRAGASEELATIAAKLDTDYSTAKFTYNGRILTLDDMEDLLRTSRDPNETRVLWEGWRAASSPQMKSDYVRPVELANEGSRELGYADTGGSAREHVESGLGKHLRHRRAEGLVAGVRLDGGIAGSWI